MGSERKIAVCLVIFLLYAAGSWKDRRAVPESISARQAVPQESERPDGPEMPDEAEKTPVAYSAEKEASKDEKTPACLQVPSGEKQGEGKAGKEGQPESESLKTSGDAVQGDADAGKAGHPESPRQEISESPADRFGKSRAEDSGKGSVSADLVRQGERFGQATGEIRYLTRQEDSLWKIARRFYRPESDAKVNEAVQEIVRANPWLKNPQQLQPDRILLLPVLTGERRPANERENEASQDGESWPKPRRETDSQPVPKSEQDRRSAPEPEKSSFLGEFTRHCVAKGQTLRQIARHYYGDERMWLSIHDANPGIDPQSIPCGLVLNIPRKKNE